MRESRSGLQLSKVSNSKESKTGMIVMTDVAMWEFKQEETSNDMMPPGSPEGATSLVPLSFSAAFDNQGGFKVHTKTEPSASEAGEHKSTLDYPSDIVIKQEMETAEDADCFVVDLTEVSEDEDMSGIQLTGDYKWSYGAVVKLEKENFLQIVPDTHSISDARSKKIETQQGAEGAMRQRNMNSIMWTDVVALREIKQEHISNNMMPPSNPEGAISLVHPFALDNQGGVQVHTKTEPSASEAGEHKSTLDYPLDIVIKQEMETEEGEDCFEDQQSTVDYPLDIVIKHEMEAAEDADCFVVEQVEISEDGDTSEATLTSDLKWSDGAVVKSEKESLHQNVPDTHSISDTSEEMSNSQQQAMRMHRRQEETFQEKTDHTCSVCGIDFEESQACLWHMWQNHTLEKTYKCHMCKKAFKDIKSLRRHGEYHKNERPYFCDVCGSTFKRKSHVQKHVATYHPDQWPYSCDLCEKTFKQRAHVQRHLATCHPGQRPHICDLCEEIFKEKADVHLHIAIYHPGERPFSCDVCEKTFKRKAHLRQHKASFHHVEKPFS